MLRSYTCNVQGDCVVEAKDAGYHAYYASGVTAIEVKAKNKRGAWSIASRFGKVLYIFE
jgi:hypothetical protein